MWNYSLWNDISDDMEKLELKKLVDVFINLLFIYFLDKANRENHFHW